MELEAPAERVGLRPWLMLSVALLSQVSVAMMTQGIPTLAPVIRADLSLTRGQVGLFGSALMFGSIVALAAVGWAVDHFGERSVLFWGNLFCGVFACAAAATTHYIPALIVLFLAGIGSAGPTPAGSKAVMAWFPARQRGMAMGVRQTGIPLGGVLAAAILAPLALSTNWRVSILVTGVACIVCGVVCLWYRNPEDDQPATDKGHRAPGLGLRQVLTRDVALLGLVGALLPPGQFCLVTYLALYLKETHGISLSFSAGLLVAAQLAGAAGRVLWGRWSDTFFGRRRRPALLAAAFSAAVLAAMLGLLPKGVPLWAIYAVVLVYGFNAIGWHGVWVLLLAELAGPERQGRTLGVAMTIMYLGIVVTPPLFGFLVDRTGAWRLAWLLLGLMLGLGGALVLPVREGRA